MCEGDAAVRLSTCPALFALVGLFSETRGVVLPRIREMMGALQLLEQRSCCVVWGWTGWLLPNGSAFESRSAPSVCLVPWQLLLVQAKLIPFFNLVRNICEVRTIGILSTTLLGLSDKRERSWDLLWVESGQEQPNQLRCCKINERWSRAWPEENDCGIAKLGKMVMERGRERKSSRGRLLSVCGRWDKITTEATHSASMLRTAGVPALGRWIAG